MRIAINISPVEQVSSSPHKHRGAGVYIKFLKQYLIKYDQKNEYIFFTSYNNIPRNVDLVHYPYFDPFFLSIPMIRTNKSVITVHDLIPLLFPEHFPPGAKGRLRWYIQKFFLKRCGAIITDSNSSRDDIERIVGVEKDKNHVVYLAAGEEFKKVEDWRANVQRIRKKYNLPERFVLYVGDVTWNKNLPRLVEAIKKINTLSAGRQVTLVMVGKALKNENFDKDNPWNKDLVEVNSLTQGDQRFIKLGFIPQEDLVNLYNMATVFAMPSLYEGFGLPVLEAAACGCAIVTSRCGSLPEVIGNSAFFIDAYDVDDIANGIGEVFFNSGIREKLAKKALIESKKFSWEKTIRETVKVYESFLESQ